MTTLNTLLTAADMPLMNDGELEMIQISPYYRNIHEVAKAESDKRDTARLARWLQKQAARRDAALGV
jgi:hypothetical protein